MEPLLYPKYSCRPPLTAPLTTESLLKTLVTSVLVATVVFHTYTHRPCRFFAPKLWPRRCSIQGEHDERGGTAVCAQGYISCDGSRRELWRSYPHGGYRQDWGKYRDLAGCGEYDSTTIYTSRDVQTFLFLNSRVLINLEFGRSDGLSPREGEDGAYPRKKNSLGFWNSDLLVGTHI